GPAGKACTASEPRNGKAKLQPPLEPAVPQQMKIHRAVEHREAQPRHGQVYQLFPHVYGVELFVFHVQWSRARRRECTRGEVRFGTARAKEKRSRQSRSS